MFSPDGQRCHSGDGAAPTLDGRPSEHPRLRDEGLILRLRLLVVVSGIAKFTKAHEGALSAIQPAYCITTGIWPLTHYRSFEKVSGPLNPDDWLVKTVGLLISFIAQLYEDKIAAEATLAILLFPRHTTGRPLNPSFSSKALP